MSRILEALKRAEELRTTASAEEPQPPDSASPGAVPNDGAVQSASEPPSPLGGALSISQCLRLEELRQRCAKPGWKLDPDDDAFLNKPSLALCAEQFRTLRSRLYQWRGMKPIRSLLVTSTVAGEGKTFVALNLAQAIARQHERRVLLIDADLRAARLHLAMGAPFMPGLADYLRGEANEFPIVQGNTKDNLFFIPAGSPVSNPAELLANQRLKRLLDRLTPLFDWVIFDAPPVLPVSDASVLGELCDGVIMVIRAGSTAFDLAQTACQEFKEKNLLGVVLNRAEEEAERYGGYGYYGTRRDGVESHVARHASLAGPAAVKSELPRQSWPFLRSGRE